MISVGYHRIFVFLFVTSVIISSCVKERIVPLEEGRVPMNISGGISQTQTRASANGFETGDAIGLYAVNYLDGNGIPGALSAEGNQADNVKYSLEGSGKWSPVRPTYYKDINTHVDLYCYYPYQRTPTDINSGNFEVSKDQSILRSGAAPGGYESSDLLWGKVRDVSPTENAVPVSLNHIMSCAVVELSEGSGFGEGEFGALEKTVIVTNTTRKSTVNYATGEVTAVGGAQPDGIVSAQQSDGTFRAIVVPQQVAPSLALFSITLSGENYVFTPSEAVTFVPGKILRFSIKINKKEAGGGYELSYGGFSVQQWYQDNVVHIGEARQYYCVTVKTPGTLGRLIKQAGKNPDKIRNIKVSGNITAEDFYFMRDSMAILEAVNLREAKVKQVRIRHINDSQYYYNWDDFDEEFHDGVIPSEAFREKESLLYFVFPEEMEYIDIDAFYLSNLSGAVVLPDNVRTVEARAFQGTNITSITMSPVLERVGNGAFSGTFDRPSTLSCELYFPETLKYIGIGAFDGHFTGHLSLPESLEFLGGIGGEFSGDLRIPDKITSLKSSGFGTFTGTLDLNNVTELGENTFYYCGFCGELIIPEGVVEIPRECFRGNKFSSIQFPKTLKTIENFAFYGVPAIGDLVFPEGLIAIGKNAFNDMGMISSITFPSTLQVIGQSAFARCGGISNIICNSNEPPIVNSGAFDGVAKDNFTVQVPEESVILYQTDTQWGEFKRISGHKDFSISRNLLRATNQEYKKTLLLRSPEGQSWCVESKPDWVEVSPASGNGKTEVMITVHSLPRNPGSYFQLNELFQYGSSSSIVEGRTGEIVFSKNDDGFQTSLTVQQFDSDFSEGDVMRLQSASKGPGIDIVFLGDCYDANDIRKRDYYSDIKEATDYLFDIEPYKTYKDYFNVYMVVGLSEDSGVGTVNTIRSAKFGSQYQFSAGIVPDLETCFEYAAKAPVEDLSKTLVVLICNTEEYGGVTYMFGDGSAVAVCPKSREAFPYDFRGLVQHEAGGHGFGKLADEYIYHSAFIQACDCPCCSHEDALMSGKSLGWYRNLELTGSQSEVGWSHLIFNPKYSDIVDVFEGGYFHTRGVFRSEATSCMNNNIPYFSTISRQAIVERIMEYAGEEFTLEKFYENDKISTGAGTKTGGKDPRYETYPSNGRHNPPVYAGDRHPEIKTH